jgi:hypothetical protein
MPTPETAFKAALRRWFDRFAPHGFWTPISGSFGQTAGLPDVLCGNRGKHAWIEVKTENYSLAPLQNHVCQQLAARCGFRVVLVTREGVVAHVALADGTGWTRLGSWGPNESEFWKAVLG